MAKYLSVHKSLTVPRVERAVKRGWTSLENPGFCIACGKSQDGCEPDAARYTCQNCGKPAVYGAELLLMSM